MDSYAVSCKYAEPQFPPCEEDYSNFSDQGGYYNSPQDSGGYGGGYQSMQPPPPLYTAQQTGYQHSVQAQQRQHQQQQQRRREDAEEHSHRHQGASFPDYRETDAPGKQGYPVGDLQCQAWMTYAKPAQVQRKTACQGKDKPPIVVYPWMKKVHVAHGEDGLVIASLSITSDSLAVMMSSFSFFLSFFLSIFLSFFLSVHL